MTAITPVCAWCHPSEAEADWLDAEAEARGLRLSHGACKTHRDAVLAEVEAKNPERTPLGAGCAVRSAPGRNPPCPTN